MNEFSMCHGVHFPTQNISKGTIHFNILVAKQFNNVFHSLYMMMWNATCVKCHVFL